MHKKLLNKSEFQFMLIFFLVIALYYRPVFSNTLVGIDGMGHLTKIKYMREFNFPKWNMVWYSGTPFLKFYPPLFYYLSYLFSFILHEIIVVKLLCLLSIFLTAFGIFFLVKGIANTSYSAFLSSILFLTIINISYYFLSAGNYPFIFSLWTLPFSPCIS